MRKSFSEVVLGKLLLQQRRLGLSDERMGQALGLHQSQVTRLRLGLIRAGARVLDGAACEYPELVVEAVAEVAGRPLVCGSAGCSGAVTLVAPLSGPATVCGAHDG